MPSSGRKTNSGCRQFVPTIDRYRWLEPKHQVNDPISIAAGGSVSDLPIRQTYYFPPEPRRFDPPNAGSALLQGPALLMASYNDAEAVSYWKSLEDPRDLKPRAHARMKSAAAAMYTAALNTGNAFQKHVAEIGLAMAEEPGFYPGPPEMVRHAQEQLRFLHFNQPLPDPMPDPQGKPGDLLAAYKDWDHDPYGGGWNFWAPGVNVKQVMGRIRRPFSEERFFIVGEAYSGNQGWVEGALSTAEHVLRDYFNLQPARWQPQSLYVGY